MPVEEITPVTEESTEVSDVVVAAVEDQGVVFELARVVELEDGFLFEGTIKWIGEESAWPNYQSGIEVYDANGQRVPNEQVDPDPLFALRSNTKTGWAVRTYSKSSPGPWTITLPQIGLGLLPNIVFLIDLGDSPQVGQEWQVSHCLLYTSDAADE